MPSIPFDPTDLASALPDVVAAIGIALVLAIITFKPRRASTTEEALEAMRVAQERLQQQQQPPQESGS